MPAPVTRKQLSVLQAIRRHQLATGLSPTLEELGRALDVNRITAYGHVQALVEKGYLHNRARGASRALDLTPAGLAVLKPLESQHEQPALPFPPEVGADSAMAGPDPAAGPPTASRLPILGRIAAGFPLEAVENREECTLDELLRLRGTTYLLQVQGDSMIEDHIQDGDWVVVRHDQQPNEGDIVVAILEDGEATLKRLYRAPGGFRLQPANHTMAPLFVNQVEVRGVVIGVLRRYRS